MDAKLVSLIAASAAFVGSHFLLSHPLRARLVAAVGPGGFQALYSLFAFAGLGWMVMAFVAIGPQGAVLWDGTSDAIWALTSLAACEGVIGRICVPPRAAIRETPAIIRSNISSVTRCGLTNFSTGSFVFL